MLFNNKKFRVRITYVEFKEFLESNGYKFPEEIATIDIDKIDACDFTVSVELEDNL